MAVTAPIHTLQDYLNQAAPVLLQIPGFPQLVQADGNSYDTLAKKYPDAAFTMMVMNNLFHHDSEFSEIHQQAFSSIVEGTNISSVRKRYKPSRSTPTGRVTSWMPRQDVSGICAGTSAPPEKSSIPVGSTTWHI